MSNSEFSNTELDELLSAVTDALLAEEDIDAIISRYAVPRAQVDSLLWVIRRLHLALVGVQPSQRFVRRLRADLVGGDGYSVVRRVRHLPPRVRVAAGLTLIVGFMFLQRRRMVDDAIQQDAQEMPTLQTHPQ